MNGLKGSAAFTHFLKEYSGGKSMEAGVQRIAEGNWLLGYKSGYKRGYNDAVKRLIEKMSKEINV